MARAATRPPTVSAIGVPARSGAEDASPVNPSDIAFLRGGYNIVKPVPVIPGFEGVGKIVAIGGKMDKAFVGKRITFFSQDDESGAWAEYAVVGENDFILKVVAKDWDTYQHFLTHELTAAPNVEHVKTSLGIRVSKFLPGVPVELGEPKSANGKRL